MTDYSQILYDKCSEELAQIETIMSEYNSNPLYWSNNKRRLNGLKPLRKKSNNRKHPSMKLVWQSFDILDGCLKKCIPNLVEQSWVCMTDIKSVSLGEKKNFIKINFDKEEN